MSLSQEQLKRLLCSICDKYLSVFPTFITSNGASICGRCIENQVIDVTKNHILNSPYEEIAKDFIFPCIYANEGCLEQVTPSQAKQHEKTCIYKTMNCPVPISFNCFWQGQLNELIEHLKANHQDILINGDFEINLVTSYQLIYYLIKNNDIFVFHLQFNIEKRNFQCWIQYLDSENIKKKTYKYNVTLFNGSKKLNIKFPQRAVTNGSEIIPNDFSLDSVLQQLNSPTAVIGNVDIYLDKKEPKIRLDEKFFSQFECPICLEYFTPPIFLCESGHSFCSICKASLKECSLCRQPIKNSTNYVVQNLLEVTDLPCKFVENGCEFIGKGKLYKDHLQYCQYGSHSCPLQETECEWKGTMNNIIRHIQDVHLEDFLQLNTVHIYLDQDYWTYTDTRYFMLTIDGHLFKLNYMFEPDRFLWAMELMAESSECSKYKYEIEILDNSSTSKKISLVASCIPLNQKWQNDGNNFIYLMRDQVEPYIFEEKFSFKVRIIK